VSRLVLVAPLKKGARKRAEELLAHGPPFDLEETRVRRYEVFVGEREIVFLLESQDPAAALGEQGDNPASWRGAEAWRECLSGPLRVAATTFAWERTDEPDGVTFESTPGPGDSEGGDLFAP
jgi:hypothetical protein